MESLLSGLKLPNPTPAVHTERKYTDLLVPDDEEGWPELTHMFDSAQQETKAKIEAFPIDSDESARECLELLQMSTRSHLGSIVYHTGGISFFGGMVRLYGSGSKQMTNSIKTANLGRTKGLFSPDDKSDNTTSSSLLRCLLVGDDCFGGFFALNSGEFGEDRSKLGVIYRFQPKALRWDSLDIKYSEFVQWVAFLTTAGQMDFEDFYSELVNLTKWNINVGFEQQETQWKANRKEEKQDVNDKNKGKDPIHDQQYSASSSCFLDRQISFSPFPFTRQFHTALDDQSFNDISTDMVPTTESFKLNVIQFGKLKHLPEGTQIHEEPEDEQD